MDLTSSPENLQKFYDYWDNYISRWLKSDCPCCPYMPEPWWGWTPSLGSDLKCVVINLNPGAGGNLQTRESIGKLFDGDSYSKAMAAGRILRHLSKTSEWHFRYRARSILTELSLDSDLSNYHNHYLGLELCPLHSKTPSMLEEYVKSPFSNTMYYTITFAAEASHNISETCKLRNKVIVRCGPERFSRLFGDAVEKVVELDNSKHPTTIFRFKDKSISDVDFFCVWGARNKFPKHAIKEIISY